MRGGAGGEIMFILPSIFLREIRLPLRAGKVLLHPAHTDVHSGTLNTSKPIRG